MYISKISIQSTWCRDTYQLHQALWQLFPDRENDLRDFLFRVEARVPGKGCCVLLQSAHEPISSSAAQVIASKPVDYRLEAGKQLRFRLRANPVKTIKDEQKRMGRDGQIKRCRVPLCKPQEQSQWLERKFFPAAKLLNVETTAESPLFFSKKGQAGKIQPVNFEGLLLITDSSMFMSLLRQGIGPAKAMGCGMLSLARA